MQAMPRFCQTHTQLNPDAKTYLRLLKAQTHHLPKPTVSGWPAGPMNSQQRRQKRYCAVREVFRRRCLRGPRPVSNQHCRPDCPYPRLIQIKPTVVISAYNDSIFMVNVALNQCRTKVNVSQAAAFGRVSGDAKCCRRAIRGLSGGHESARRQTGLKALRERTNFPLRTPIRVGGWPTPLASPRNRSAAVARRDGCVRQRMTVQIESDKSARRIIRNIELQWQA